MKEEVSMDKRYFVLVVLSLTLVFAAGLGAAAEKQPMIYYSFDEIQEDLVLDGSGNQRNALLEGGISWTADGYKGGALYFAARTTTNNTRAMLFLFTGYYPPPA
jgi:hypothetical protein